MRKAVLLAVLIIISGCSPDYQLYSKLGMDEIEPTSLKFEAEYTSIDIEEGYEKYETALNEFKKTSSFASEATMRCYDLKENSIRSSYEKEYRVNNFFTNQALSIINVYDNNKSQEMIQYEKEQTVYGEYKLKNGQTKKYLIDYKPYGDTTLDNLSFLNLRKDYIKNIQISNEGEEQTFKYYLEIPVSRKNEFFKNDPVGKVYDVIDNEVIILIQYDEENRFNKILTTFTFDYYGAKNLVKSDMEFLNFDIQDLDFPSDLETWPLLKN